MNVYPPYFIYPDVVALKSGNISEDRRKQISRRLAALIGDQEALRIILGVDPEEFTAFYPDLQSATPSTLDTIDTFIDKFAPNQSLPLSEDFSAQPLSPYEENTFQEEQGIYEEEIIYEEPGIYEDEPVNEPGVYDEIQSMTLPSSDSLEMILKEIKGKSAEIEGREEKEGFEERKNVKPIPPEESTKPKTPKKKLKNKPVTRHKTTTEDPAIRIATNPQPKTQTPITSTQINPNPKTEPPIKRVTTTRKQGGHGEAINKETRDLTNHETRESINRESINKKPMDEKAIKKQLKKADFLIRMKDYSKALEIISALNLNNPEKSVYFAHQIRFLRKLLKIQPK